MPFTRNAYTGSVAALNTASEKGTCRWVQSIPQILRVSGVGDLPLAPWSFPPGPAMQGQPFTYRRVLQSPRPVMVPTSTSSSAPAAACAPETCASSPPAAPAQFMQGSKINHRAPLHCRASKPPCRWVTRWALLSIQSPRHTCSLQRTSASLVGGE